MPIISLFGNGSFDPETTSLLASAFEDAWETVKKSGNPLTADGQALPTREILAKRVIERARAGEQAETLVQAQARVGELEAELTSVQGQLEDDQDPLAVDGRHAAQVGQLAKVKE